MYTRAQNIIGDRRRFELLRIQRLKSKSELTKLIDDALDNGDFETVEKLHKYI